MSLIHSRILVGDFINNSNLNASPEVVKVLAGNKCEVSNQQRAVEKERGQKFAESFDMPFFEVSCRGDVMVQDTFLTLARLIRDLRQRRASLFEERERQNEGVKLEADQKGDNGASSCASC